MSWLILLCGLVVGGEVFDTNILAIESLKHVIFSIR